MWCCHMAGMKCRWFGHFNRIRTQNTRARKLEIGYSRNRSEEWTGLLSHATWIQSKTFGRTWKKRFPKPNPIITRIHGAKFLNNGARTWWTPCQDDARLSLPTKVTQPNIKILSKMMKKCQKIEKRWDKHEMCLWCYYCYRNCTCRPHL